jgi:subtilisin
LKRVTAVLATALTASLAASAGAASAADYIVVLKTGANPAAVEAKHKSKGAKVFRRYRHALRGYAARLSAQAVAEIRADSAVLFVAEDRKVRIPNPHANPRGHAGNPQALTTGIDRIDAELSSTRSGDGHGRVGLNVAVLDSGVDPRQPELRVVGGTNCSSGDPTRFDDVLGHGTAVAGVIAARDDPIGVLEWRRVPPSGRSGSSTRLEWVCSRTWFAALIS